MSLKPLAIIITLASAASLATLAVPAGEKQAGKLTGAWVKKDAELRIEFTKGDTLKILPHGDNVEIAIVCKVAVEKKGLVKATITGFEGKEEIQKKIQERLPIGTKFSFQWKATAETAMLDEIKGDQADLLKSHLEGDFEKKK